MSDAAALRRYASRRGRSSRSLGRFSISDGWAQFRASGKPLLVYDNAPIAQRHGWINVFPGSHLVVVDDVPCGVSDLDAECVRPNTVVGLTVDRVERELVTSSAVDGPGPLVDGLPACDHERGWLMQRALEREVGRGELEFRLTGDIRRTLLVRRIEPKRRLADAARISCER